MSIEPVFITPEQTAELLGTSLDVGIREVTAPST